MTVETIESWEIWCNDEWSAECSNYLDALHYAGVYSQDGVVKVYHVVKREVEWQVQGP